MRISHTLAQAGGNFARPTKYGAIIIPPASMVSTETSNLDVLCKTATVPGVINEPYEIKIKGQNVKIPGRTNQNKELTLTFYIDDAYTTRKLFQDWIEGLDQRFSGPRNGASEAMIVSNDKYGHITLIGRNFNETIDQIVFMFEDVYPTSVGEIEFDTSNKDSVFEISVTFAFSRFITDNLANHDINGVENLDDTFNGVY